MNTKLLLAAVAAMVAMFLGGWLIWGIILKSYMAMPDAEEKMGMDLLAIGHVFIGFLYAWLASVMGVRSLVKGLMNGFIIGILFALGHNFIVQAQMSAFKDTMQLIVDSIASGAWAALGMGAAALVLGMNGKKEA